MPGSAKAIEADKNAEAERGRNRRASARLEKAASTPLPPVANLATPEGAPTLGVVAAAPGSFVPEWTAADLQCVGADVVELWEQVSVGRKIKRATDGKLLPVVVEKIGKDAAFPPKAKQTLQTSCGGSLAQLFNAAHVPISLKSVISTAPALVYLIVRDLSQSANIDKLIAAEAERTGAKPAGKT